MTPWAVSSDPGRRGGPTPPHRTHRNQRLPRSAAGRTGDRRRGRREPGLTVPRGLRGRAGHLGARDSAGKGAVAAIPLRTRGDLRLGHSLLPFAANAQTDLDRLEDELRSTGVPSIATRANASRLVLVTVLSAGSDALRWTACRPVLTILHPPRTATPAGGHLPPPPDSLAHSFSRSFPR
jgi:hypothetical protein